MKDKVLVIVGPTAVGKTGLGIELAKRFNGEVISGDSQQVYRGLDIGTAKVTETEQEGIPHHLINIREVQENFSVYDFLTAVGEQIPDILSRRKLPILVGGTGLYIQALIEGYHLGGRENHQQMVSLRQALDQMDDGALFKQACHLKIPQPNRRRVIRALELEKYGGGENIAPSYHFHLIALSLPRLALYQRIENRVDQMMAAGLEEEARWLFETVPESQAAKAIGYKEFFPYFRGEISKVEAISKVKQHSRNFAKRQVTWFRNRMALDFVDVAEQDFPENVIMQVREFLYD